MLPSAVVCVLPFRINDRPFSNFHDAVARRQARFTSSIDEFNVRPLIAMVVNVVRDLAEQDALRFQNTIGFLHERRKRVSERIVVLFG